MSKTTKNPDFDVIFRREKARSGEALLLFVDEVEREVLAIEDDARVLTDELGMIAYKPPTGLNRHRRTVYMPLIALERNCGILRRLGYRVSICRTVNFVQAANKLADVSLAKLERPRWEPTPAEIASAAAEVRLRWRT